MPDERYHAFDDPALDQMLGIVLALGGEVWSLRDRIALLEQALADRDIDVAAAIEELAADDDRVSAMTADRDAFLERFLGPLTE